ncbi:AMP-binding domain containing protein [Asbolus verrucosus]|uniref:AMP-binding domain containing protein n=1 Tax=Asbolus verrucosus TaxID=1661398 RepID=A0A482VXX8_ASBVE|nr:AMP-binding domain containing protein [Asbolus verrucosus]
MIVVFGKSIKYVTFSDLDKPQENEEEFKPVMVDICNTALIFFSRAGGYRIISNHIDDGEIIFKTVEKYKVTHLFMAPILTYKLTNCKKWDAYDTSSLYTVLTGGTPISPVQFQKLDTIFRHSNIILTYGLTETGLMSAYNPRTDQKFINNKIGSSGKLLPCMTVKIVDLETKEILGPNQKGEIYIKTPALMTEYYHFDTSDILDKDGFLKTGDVGYYDEEECFYIIDRVKEMFKFMSWHIVPSSIENVLLECPAVEKAAVFGIPKSEEEGEVPAACVVLREHFNASKEEIAEFVAARVSDREELRGIDATIYQRESYFSMKQRSTGVALELQKRGITCKDVIVLCTKVTLDNVIPILASFYR